MSSRNAAHMSLFFGGKMTVKLISITPNAEATILVDPKYTYVLGAYKWTICKQGRTYRAIHTRNKKVLGTRYLHQYIWFLEYGYFPARIDHINGNSLDNRLENLRECTHAQNMQNSRKRQTGTSKYKGVYWDKSVGLFKARIQNRFLGSSSSEEECAEIYRIAAQEIYGEFFFKGENE